MINLLESQLSTPALDFCDVMIQPAFGSFAAESTIRSRADVELRTEFLNANESCRWYGIPLVASNMDCTGTFRVARILSEFKMLTFLRKSYTVADFRQEQVDPNFIGITAGLKDLDNITEILDFCPEIPFVCLDVANGYLRPFHNLITTVRGLYPNTIIVAGNVCTHDGASVLQGRGADLIKIGIGSGSLCLTREKTGVGVPQFSALDKSIWDPYQFSDEPPMPVMSDGGCTVPGDIAKAFAVGSRFVMIGGMFVGCEETMEDTYGMSSTDAMVKHSGVVADYKTSEGRTLRNKVFSGGTLKDRVLDILGGLRSSCTYTGHASLRNFINAEHRFNVVNRQLNRMWE